MSDTPEPTTRRAFISCAGAVAGIGTLAAIGSAEDKRKDSNRVIHLKGDRSNPIKNRDIRKAVQKSRSNHVNRGNSPPDKDVAALPSNKEGDLIEFIIAHGSGGETYHYGGIAEGSEGVKMIRERAKTRKKQIGERVRKRRGKDSSASQANNEVTASASLGSSSNHDTYYDEVDHGNWDYANDPYGVVTNNWDLYYLYNDNDSDKDNWAFKHWHVIEPGTRAFNSNWRGHRGHPKHDWSINDLGGVALDQHGPTTDLDKDDKNISVNLGVNTAYLSWNYTKDKFQQEDKTSYYNDYAKWKLIIKEPIDQKLVSVNPGSSAWLDEGTGTILKMKGNHKFVKWVLGLKKTYTMKPHWWIESAT